MDRREFLRRCACVSLGGAGLSLFSQEDALGQSAPDYKALVCVFLFGGNDAFNMVVPRSGAEFNLYATSRQNLAIPSGSLLAITPQAPVAGGGEYGFNPACPELTSLFEGGRLAILANVGTLVAPVTRAEYLARSVALPPQLFSHNDQQHQWQTSRPGVRENTGWCGRMADALTGGLTGQQLAVNVSIAGANVLQAGRTTVPYTMSSAGVVTVRGIDDQNAANRRRRTAFMELLDQTVDHPLAREMARVQRRGIENAERLTAALEAVQLQTTFPQGGFGGQLAMAARVIGARTALMARRQVFFISLGGWDTHGEQATRHPQLLQTLSQGLSAFWQALGELQAQDLVTTFTASDFGRTLTSNGDGTDHGWGSHQLILGGAVRGRQIYGTMPRLEIGGPDDTRGGRLIPTTAVDQYGATLARWMGLQDAELAQVFPNLGRFASPDLGFML